MPGNKWPNNKIMCFSQQYISNVLQQNMKIQIIDIKLNEKDSNGNKGVADKIVNEWKGR